MGSDESYDHAWWGGRVLLEDESYVVLDKPAGIPCQPVHSNSSAHSQTSRRAPLRAIRALSRAVGWGASG
eukprot:183078-Prorocentrum_minimum.AAC.1